MKQLTTTLLIAVRKNQILLAMKKHGHGEGHWNGVGGKVEPGETIEQAMIRECQEEIGITPTAYTKVAENLYDQPYKGERCHNTAHIYFCTKWQGTPVESDEMAPRWFPKDSIPYDHMWPDDIHWLPLVLGGKKLRTMFRFTPDNSTITLSEITEVTQFDEP